jgi:hypothetical protein
MRLMIMKLIKSGFALLVLSVIVMSTGCSPEIGSDEWCEDMKEKPKKDWTASEAADYTKHCVF